MRGQMFVLTMVFLVGLIFVVQQGFINWFSYSVEFSAGMQKDDFYVLDNMKAMAEQTMSTSLSCEEARTNMDDLRNFLYSRLTSGYFLEFNYRLNCLYWNNGPPSPAPLNLTIQITGENTDTSGSFLIYR
jgi:hypothetical protein